MSRLTWLAYNTHFHTYTHTHTAAHHIYIYIYISYTHTRKERENIHTATDRVNDTKLNKVTTKNKKELLVGLRVTIIDATEVIQKRH